MDVSSPVLVGRAAELAVLDAAARRAPGTEPFAAFVVGEAGVGKSRLVSAVSADARRAGVTVLTGRAVDTGTPMAYRPMAEALLAAVRARPDAQGPLGPAARALLHRFAPGTVAADVAAVTASPSPVAVAEGLLRTLTDVDAGAGALLVLEDLHWADADTLAAVEYLADNLQPLRAGLVATFRPEAPPLRQLARALTARGSARVVELARLGRAETVAMAEACLGGAAVPDEVAQLLATFSEGLPLLVEELLATLLERGSLVAGDGRVAVRGPLVAVAPGSIRDAVAERLQGLLPEHHEIVATAALLGRAFDWRVLAHATGASPAALDAALSAAVATHLVDPGDALEPDRFSFHHALTREAVLASLTAPARSALAAKSLDAVEAATGPFSGELLGVAADLALHAGQHERAATLLRTTANEALAHGGLGDAIHSLGRAVAIAPVGARVADDAARDLLQALAQAGRTVEAFAVGERLLATADRAETHYWLASAAATGTDWARAQSELDAAIAARPDAVLQSRVDALAARLALGRFDVHGAEAAALRALRAAEALGVDDVVCEALEALGRCARTRDLAEAETLFERQRTVARRAGLWLLELRAMHELGTIDFLLMRPVDRLRETAARADELGVVSIATLARFHTNLSRFIQFDLDGLQESDVEVLDTARRYGLGQLVPASLLLVAQTCMITRDTDGMERAIAEASTVAQDDPERLVVIWAMRGLSALADEDRPRGVGFLRQALDLCMQFRYASPGMYHGLWALISAVGGDDGAPALLHERTVSTLSTLNQGLIALADAVVAGRAGRAEDAARLVAAGDALLAPAPWFLRLARRYLAESALDHGWADPVPWLRDAEQFFAALPGYERVVGACQALLRRAGVAPARRSAGDEMAPALARLGVTAREADVLAELAEGCSNKEIADRLFLSVRTVEKHVERLLAKTGTSSRAQLIAWAAKQ